MEETWLPIGCSVHWREPLRMVIERLRSGGGGGEAKIGDARTGD